MADTKPTTQSSATKPPTPTQLALAATERAAKAEAELDFCNEQLTARVEELEAAKAAQRPAPAKRTWFWRRNAAVQPEPVVLVVPPPPPQQRPAAVAEARSGGNGLALLLAALLLILLAYAGGSHFSPWWKSHFGSLSTETSTIAKACPDGTLGVSPDCAPLNTADQKVDARAPISTVCNIDCLKIKLEAMCGEWNFSFDGPLVEGMSEEGLLRLMVESKKCPAKAKPLPLPPKVVYKTKVVKKVGVYDPPPVVETACYLRVATWADSGRDQPYYKPVNVYLAVDGGEKLTSGQQVQGLEEISVPCSMVYSEVNLEVCFGNGRESELLKVSGKLAQMQTRYERAKAAGKSHIVLNTAPIWWYPG